MYPKFTRSSSVSSETLAHLDMYYVEASGFQLTHRQPDLTSRSAAFLNCQCASAVPLIPLSSQKCTGQQLNSMVLLKDLVLPFFFPEKFKGSRSWTSVMIWADLIKKADSPTYLIWQHASNMGLTWLFFLVSQDPPLTQNEAEQRPTGSKNEDIRAKEIYHLHCYSNCANLMVPSLLSSRLSLGFCQRYFF